MLRSRLRLYVRLPEVAEAAREEFRERVGWWRMALGRAVELWRWPAIVSTERPSMADGSKTQPGLDLEANDAVVFGEERTSNGW